MSSPTANDRRRGPVEKRKDAADARRQQRAEAALAAGREPGRKGRPPGQRPDEPQVPAHPPELDKENTAEARRHYGRYGPDERLRRQGYRDGAFWEVNSKLAASALIARLGGAFEEEMALTLEVSTTEAEAEPEPAEPEPMRADEDDSDTDVGEEEEAELALALEVSRCEAGEPPRAAPPRAAPPVDDDDEWLAIALELSRREELERASRAAGAGPSSEAPPTSPVPPRRPDVDENEGPVHASGGREPDVPGAPSQRKRQEGARSGGKAPVRLVSSPQWRQIVVDSVRRGHHPAGRGGGAGG